MKSRSAKEQRLDPVPLLPAFLVLPRHYCRSPPGSRYRPRLAAPDQVRDTAHEHRGFARTRTRDHQHGTVNVLTRLPLVGRELKRLCGPAIDGVAKSMASCPWGVCFMAQKKRKSIIKER